MIYGEELIRAILVFGMGFCMGNIFQIILRNYL